MKNLAVSLARQAGAYLLAQKSRLGEVKTKGDQSNVVAEADMGSERLIINGIRRQYPAHSIISEEGGSVLCPGSPYTWVIDPLDGTSNFVARVPWYGVLIAVLFDGEPSIGVLYIPETGDIYVAERGKGTMRNGEPVRVSREQDLRNVLWAYGMDSPENEADANRDGRILTQILRRVRNVRSTNCLLDPAFTCDGRFGGMLNRSTRLWDIAAPSLIVQEAGGEYTDTAGQQLCFDISDHASDRKYAVLAGAPQLHAQILELIQPLC